MKPVEHALREAIISVACAMGPANLTRGSSGNVSARLPAGSVGDFLITPTGMPYSVLKAADIVPLDLAGQSHGSRLPSSEWRIHSDIYAQRPEVGAILHAHAPFATALACLRRSIPPFHYMIARFGGADVRCADYATFGTVELSRVTLGALTGRKACLLANHGMIVLGETLDEVLALAIDFEDLCEQYWRALQLGEPVLLDRVEMERVLEKFASYGQQAKTED